MVFVVDAAWIVEGVMVYLKEDMLGLAFGSNESIRQKV